MSNKQSKKEVIINEIIDDLKCNIYESKEYIFDLVKEALNTRTLKELNDINNGQ
jgi:hypothetical protein